GLGETLRPQTASVAPTAGAVEARVAGPREVERGADLHTETDDVSLREVDQRGTNLDRPAPDPSLQRQRRRPLERFDELRAAVGIAAVVEGVDAEVHGVGVAGFGNAHGDRKEDQVSRRD